MTRVSGREARTWRRPLAVDPAIGTAAVLLAALCCLWIWWGWKQGAFFGVVFYPGAIAGFAVIALMLIRAPLAARFAGPSALAAAALAGLAIWTALSVLWSPTKAVAVADAERALLYLAVFLIGFWTCNLLGRRMGLSLLPLAIAGAVIGIATTLVLLTGDDFRNYLHGDATLRYPLGYRNADAALFLLGFWALLTFAGVAGRWPGRAAAIAAATMLLDLAILAQSRGSVVAIGVAVVLYLAFAPRRLEALLILVLAVAPALLAAPRLLDVYQHGAADPEVLGLLRSAARWTFASGAASLLLAALVLLPSERRLRAVEPQTLRRMNRAVAVVCSVLALGGAAAFVAAKGGPGAFLNQRLLEVRRGGEFHGEGTRFGVNLGSNRGDFWRVSIDDAQRDPLLGDGAGGFRFSYLQRRDSPITPEDPHSVEMLMLSELGLPGLALLLTFLAAATLACLRSRRLGPSASALIAGALTCGAYWLAHASLDWFWSYPAVTAPVIALLGAAAAPSALALGAQPRQRWRLGLAGLMAAAAIAAVPLFLADRYRNRAVAEWPADSGRAFDDLDLAADLDPLDEEPLLLKGAIALRVDRPGLALDALEEARSRAPENYASYYFLARTLQASDPEEARRNLAAAEELNPDGPELKRLERRLAETSQAEEGPSASRPPSIGQ